MHIYAKTTLQGQILLAWESEHALTAGKITGHARLRCGDILGSNQGGQIQLLSRVRLPGEPMSLAWAGQVLSPMFAAGEHDCCLERTGFSLAWITLSDKGARGERQDLSGPAIHETVATAMDLCLATGTLIADEPLLLKETLVDFCLAQGFDLVMTTGGTGLGPRDITPEVTLSVLDKRLPGFEQIMTDASLAKTPHGMISRAVAGTLGQSLVINLPGSPKAVRENLKALLPALKHALQKLQGDSSDCGR